MQIEEEKPGQQLVPHIVPLASKEDILEEIRRSSTSDTTFYLMNLFAAIVASYGLLANSAPVVIGAMVIAVLLGPISGIGLALVSRDRTLLGKSAFALLTGTLEVFLVAFLIGSIHRSIPLTHEILSRTEPNLFDLMIALAGGAAGAYAVGRRVPGGTLVGVAIATALVPPIASSAIVASHGDWHLAGQALLLFFTNLIAIQCSYSIVLYLLNISPEAVARSSFKKLIGVMSPSLVILVGLAILLGVVLKNQVDKQNTDSKIRTSLESAVSAIPGANLGEVTVTQDDSEYLVIASIRTPFAIAPDTVRGIEESIRPGLDHPIRLTVRSIIVRVADRNGYVFGREALKQAFDEPQAATEIVQDSDRHLPQDTISRIMAGMLLHDSLKLDSLKLDSIRIDSVKSDSMHIHKNRRTYRESKRN